MFLSLVDLAQRPVEPGVDSLTVRLTCTNRDLPSRLPFGNEAGDFELEGALPVKRIVALIKPTPACVRRRQGRALASHLPSLAQLSFPGRRRPRGAAGNPQALQFHGLRLFAQAD